MITKKNLSRSLRLFLWIIFLFTPNSMSAKQAIEHIIQPGETLTDIAEMYRLRPEEIARSNHLDITSPLISGERLLLKMPINMHKKNNGILHSKDHQIHKSIDLNTKKNIVLKGDPYAYYGNGEPVSEALKSFAGNYGLPIIISNEVDSTINGTIGPLPPISFLDQIAQFNNLIWYFDGDTLYVYNSNEIQKKIINLKYLSIEGLRKTLYEMGIWDKRYGWRERPSEGLIYVSGPPRYIELVSQTAGLIDEKTRERETSQLDFRVFPLKYARAEDYTVSYRNQQMTIPGVATLLKQIVLTNDGMNIEALNTPTQTKSVAPATPITGKQPPKLASQNVESAPKGNASIASENIFINADRRLNSVIVHDLASKMPMYANLIKTLDKPLSQVEINVSIIDVDTSSIDELGIDWKLDSNGGKSHATFDPKQSLLKNSSATILNVTAGRLLSQVKMLATRNKAKILSRPSVLTLNNMEAVLDNSQTFYVKVQGGDANSNTAQLYPITSGSVLKVTPRIIKEQIGKKIHLDVNIQDGGSESTNSLGNDVTLPIVKNTTINTQAIIDENQSLLVGGYFYEKKSTKVEKIPLLGDLPVMKHFFRQTNEVYTKNVRLFLITPQVVSNA